MSDKVSGFVCGFALGLIYACACISRPNITIVTGSEKKEEKEESHDRTSYKRYNRAFGHYI